jgi:hypothetical protein
VVPGKTKKNIAIIPGFIAFFSSSISGVGNVGFYKTDKERRAVKFPQKTNVPLPTK